jgi:F0F1-type ATP synthase membrane subunit b/b'
MWLEKKEEEFNKSQPGQTNAPQVGAGGGAAPAGSITPITGTTTSPIASPQITQKWATAQDYLRANQPQATELGQKVETSLTGTLGEQQKAIESAGQQAKQQVQSGITAFNPEIAKTAVEAPTQITQSPEKLQDFLKQWNAFYTGPTSFETSESYAPASEAATKGKEISEEIKTPGGRQQLLQNQFGVYGAGNQALDLSLLGTAQNYGNIQQLAPKFESLQDYLTQQSQGISKEAQKAQEATQAAQEQTRAALAGNLDKFQKDLAARVGTTQQEAAVKTQQYQADLTSGNVDKIAVDLRASGIAEDQIKPIIDNLTLLNQQYKYNPNLIQGYEYNPATAITTENVATPEDYAKAQAWAQLTGEQGYTTTLNPANIAQAGTAPNVKTGFLPDYLKQQTGILVKQKDDYLLTNTAVKVSDYIKPEDMNNKQSGEKLAATFLNAMKRQGITPPPGTVKGGGLAVSLETILPPALKELYQQMITKQNTEAGKAFMSAVTSWAMGSGWAGQV